MELSIVIIAIIYIVAIFIAFHFIKEWDNKSWEKVLFSIAWPLALIIYIVRLVHKSI